VTLISQGNQDSGSVRGCAPLESDSVVGLLGELGWAFVTCVSGSGAHGSAATKWSNVHG